MARSRGTALGTGGGGAGGGAVRWRLVAEGRGVRALTRSEASARELEAAGAAPVRGDIMDPASLGTAMAGCAVVYHVAGLNGFCLPDPHELTRVNVWGTRSVVTAAGAAGVRRVVARAGAAGGVGGGRDGDWGGGVCVEGACCESEARVCGSACCAGAEVCFANACVTPGGTCTSAGDCAEGEYCELGLGEGSMGDICASAVTGRCLELPPSCADAAPGAPPAGGWPRGAAGAGPAAYGAARRSSESGDRIARP